MTPLLAPALFLTLSIANAAAPRPVTLVAQDDPECPRWRRAFAAMPTETLALQTSSGRRVSIVVKVAASDETQRAGFQCASRDAVRTTVILFDFGREVLGGFHMQNVPVALDIAFVKTSGRIFSILRMDPSPTARYGPLGAYRYAFEARAGFSNDLGIAPGDSALLDRAKGTGGRTRSERAGRERAGWERVPGKEVTAMHVARAIFVALLGAVLASTVPSQALAASHQPAAPEQKAEKAAKPAASGTRRHMGTVKAVDQAAGTLTVTEKEGDAEASVSDKTTIKKGKESMKLSDLKPGDEVTVTYVKQEGKDVARSVMVKAK